LPRTRRRARRGDGPIGFTPQRDGELASMRTTPIKTYLEPGLARAISRLALAQARSDSSVVAEFVRSRLAAAGPEAERAEADGLKRQLACIEALQDKTIVELAQLKECMLLFVRVWLEYNPELDAAHEEAAPSAEVRFERFLDLIGASLASA